MRSIQPKAFEVTIPITIGIKQREQTARTLFEVSNFEVWTLERDKAFEVAIPIPIAIGTIGIKQRRWGTNSGEGEQTTTSL